MNTTKSPHHPHILPLRLYIGIGLALLILTIITVWVAQIPLGPYNLVVALTIATIKAVLVGLFFMHLIYDNKLYLIIYALSLIILGIFIILTLFDTMQRGDLYPEVSAPIEQKAVINTTAPGVDSMSVESSKEH
jgi:cytochrome c oxidase subunit IV